MQNIFLKNHMPKDRINYRIVSVTIYSLPPQEGSNLNGNMRLSAIKDQGGEKLRTLTRIYPIRLNYGIAQIYPSRPLLWEILSASCASDIEV